MRVFVVVATVAVLLWALSACTTDAAPTSTPPATVQTPQPPPRIEGADAWQPFELYTHCGIDRSLIEFDGEFWEALGPGRLNDGSGNPPPGFGNPSDRGWITRIDDDTAAYESSEGVPLFLRRLGQQPDVGVCF